MSVQPVISHENNVQQLTDPIKAQNNSNNKNSNSKPLKDEATDSVILSISDEGMYLSLLTEGVAKGDKAPQVAQSAVRTMEYGIKLLQTIKELRLEGNGTGNELEDLAKAYDVMQGRLNENSVNSQKHVKFLNDAFKDLARFYFVKNAELSHNSENPTEISTVSVDSSENTNTSGVVNDDNITDITQPPAVNNDGASQLKLKQMISEAGKQSVIFADIFLSNYKKLGMNAFELAIRAVDFKIPFTPVNEDEEDTVDAISGLPEQEQEYSNEVIEAGEQDEEAEALEEMNRIDIFA